MQDHCTKLCMLGTFRKPSAPVAPVEQLIGWTRERFQLREGAVILATEIQCQVPGCPPLETVVAFWGSDNTRYRFKVFKPLAEVTEDDLPVAWSLPSLIDYDGLGCDCC